MRGPSALIGPDVTRTDIVVEYDRNLEGVVVRRAKMIVRGIERNAAHNITKKLINYIHKRVI
jgi:hypothetical protein